jgi:hypothetical protein
MRKLIISILLISVMIFALTSTRSNNPVSLKPLNENELKLWSNHGDTIFKRDTAVAVFEHYEYEYNPNHKNKVILPELCFIQIDNNPDNTIELIRYAHTIHSTTKIQVESKDQYDKIKYWRFNLEK